ncbi:TetR/AcrR family transcriptional regulator [Zavarzinia sp.]|uniref:TetR/AcrR family transcriptional regulator n=1 Tax=Zavarzinia sp. TaxID=2027920 RepID=UPI00356634A6
MALAALPAAPKGEASTRQQIVEAALRCILKFSIEKAGISDIAREAGLTRATVYSYFPSKEEVLHAALMQVVGDFVADLAHHLEAFEAPAERLSEALVHICIEIPRNPYLRIINEPHMAAQVYGKTLTSPEGTAIRLQLLDMILQGSAGPLEPLCEIYTRMIVSMLTMRDAHPKGADDLRRFFRPLVGLAVPLTAGIGAP